MVIIVQPYTHQSHPRPLYYDSSEISVFFPLFPHSQGHKWFRIPYSHLHLVSDLLREVVFMDAPKTTEFAHIGKSVIIKGHLSGSEDLYVDGVVEGTIELQGNNLVIGPNGNVRATIQAKGVVVQGKLEGDIRATERAELRKSAVAVGDIVTQRIAIEDGAYFKGKVDVQREGARQATPPVTRAENPPETRAAAAGVPVATKTASSAMGAGTPVTKV